MYESMKLFKEKSIQEGIQIGKTYVLLEMLSAKIGELTPKLINLIENSEVEKIDKLLENIYDIDSEDDVRKILVNQ